jgi:hypothetical protein
MAARHAITAKLSSLTAYAQMLPICNYIIPAPPLERKVPPLDYRTRTERQVMQPSSFSNSLMSTVTTR